MKLALMMLVVVLIKIHHIWITKKLQVGKVEITKDSGINAGNQEITKVKSAITKETEDQQKRHQRRQRLC